MLLKTLLLCIFALPMANGSLQKGDLFHRIGTTTSHTANAFISLTVELEEIFANAQHCVDILEHFPKTYLDDPTLLTTYSAQILHTMNNINFVLNRKTESRDDYDFILNQPATTPAPDTPNSSGLPDLFPTSERSFERRNRRSMAIIQGFVAVSRIVGSFFTWITQLTQAGDIKHLKYAVKANANHIATLGRKLNEVVAAYHTLSSSISNVQDMAIKNKAGLYIVEMASHTMTTLRTIYLALIQLQANRLPIDLVPPNELQSSCDDLDLQLSRDNLRQVLKCNQLYDVDIHALYSMEHGLVIHIPVFATGDQNYLDIYRLVVTPIAITNDTLLTFKMSSDYIAIHPLRPLGKLMSSRDLSQCMKVHQHYNCPQLNFVTDLSSTCMYNVFKENLNGTIDNCKVVFLEEYHHAFQLVGNTFLVYSTVSDTLTFTCIDINGTALEDPIQFTESVRFTLNRTCPTAFTSIYRFSYQPSLGLKGRVVVRDPHLISETSLANHLADLPPIVADSLPQLGPLKLSELTPPNKFTIYARVLKTWMMRYILIFVSLSTLYVMFHVLKHFKSICHRRPSPPTPEDRLMETFKVSSS